MTSVYRTGVLQTTTVSKPWLSSLPQDPPKLSLPKDPIDKVLQRIKKPMVGGIVGRGLAEVQSQLGLKYKPGATLMMQPLGK